MVQAQQVEVPKASCCVVQCLELEERLGSGRDIITNLLSASGVSFVIYQLVSLAIILTSSFSVYFHFKMFAAFKTIAYDCQISLSNSAVRMVRADVTN